MACLRIQVLKHIATEIPVLVSNKLTYIGVINMKSFKVTVNYEYDKLASY